MPDGERWVVTESHPPASVDPHPVGEVRVWRDDGALFLLLADLDGPDLPPLEMAAVDSSDGRVMLAWSVGERTVSMQGYGVDEEVFRTVVEQVVIDDDMITVPAGELLLSEPGGNVESGLSTQVGYSPVTADGTADLSRTVSAHRRSGTPAEMYRELHEASSLGPVSEITIAGQPGYLMEGGDGSYALTALDGWVYSWQTASPDIDLAAFLNTVSSRSAAEWESAVAATDDTVEAALDAAVSRGNFEATDPGQDPELPRYVLPEPWEFDWVTDMRLWSAEDRARREALGAANALSGDQTLVLTQGFTVPEMAAERRVTLPFEVPDLVVKARLRESDDPFTPFMEGDAAPISVAGLDGYLSRSVLQDASTPDPDDTKVVVMVEVAKGNEMLTITAADHLDEATIVRFVDSLTRRGENLSDGLTSGDDAFQLLLDVAGDGGDGAGLFERWYSSMYRDIAGRRATASIGVESLTLEEFQLQIAREIGWGRNWRPLSGTSYVVAEGQEAVVLRYDADRGIAESVQVDGELDEAVELLESLEPVDIETWRELVEPYNADPTKPR